MTNLATTKPLCSFPPEVLEQRAQDPALDAFLAESIDEDPVVPFYLKVTEEQIKVIVPPLPFAAIDFPTRVSRLRRI